MYRCKHCDLEFKSKKDSDAHVIYSHKSLSPSIKKILILGGGFGGIQVLKKIQRKLKHAKVSISMVNEENYFLYTPMLPEVASGLLQASDICIPLRDFCKKSKFYQASISSIDLEQKLVTITRAFDGKVHALDYDYLVIALGSKNNFFGNRNMEKNSFTIKTIEDAISIKNHVITMLENAAQTGDDELQRKLLTFVIVGGGFAGVEMAGELNHFIRKSIKQAYPAIDENNVNVVLISSRDGILPEVGKKLGKDAMRYLKKVGVRIFTNTKATDAGEDYVKLSTEEIIPCATLIWAGGVSIDPVITSLECEHGMGGKILVDKYLKAKGLSNVFALGDCAAISDNCGNLYPPTAQHAVREAKVVAENLTSLINNKSCQKEFSYHSKGMMATIGNHVGVVSIMGHNMKGLGAWILWRSYYLLNLPSLEKKFRVAASWTLDILFKRDLTLVGDLKKKNFQQIHVSNESPSLKEQILTDL